VPHRGQAGGEGEAIVRHFLNDHLPGRYRATGGFIIDKRDGMSGHVDVIVYDALNCPVYRTSSEGMVVPNDNVAAVVEVKFQLTTTTLDEALDKIHEVKNLAKTPLADAHPPGQIIGTQGVIFGIRKPRRTSDARPAPRSDGSGVARIVPGSVSEAALQSPFRMFGVRFLPNGSCSRTVR